MTDLIDRIADRSARVVVIGQGYVGLSVACAAARAGFGVTGIDIDADRVAELAEGRLTVAGVPEEEFAPAHATGRMRFTADTAASAEADIALVCVPTPVYEHRPDLSMVVQATEALAAGLGPQTLVVLESTTYAGTTDDLVRPILEGAGHRLGTDFLLAFAPERIDPGNQRFGFAATPRVVGGVDTASTEVALAFYELLVERVVPVSSARAAELTKLLENTFRMVNIGLANEFAILCADQGIDPWEVIDAATTKPFGFMPFYPGPGVGGHCIPIDPTYLTWQSRRDRGRPIRLVELAQDINAEMPGYVADRIAQVLNDRSKAVRGSRILAVGVTYKPDVGDTRESAAIHVMQALVDRGADLVYHDPYVPEVSLYQGELASVPLTGAEVEKADLVALLTPHSSFDLGWLIEHAEVVFDTRNATRRGRPEVEIL